MHVGEMKAIFAAVVGGGAVVANVASLGVLRSFFCVAFVKCLANA